MAGIGGGRIIDIAKAAGNMADASIFTIPTSAATCAAYAVLYVVYGEDGKEEGMIATSEIATRIADFTYSKYVRDARQALKDFDEKKETLLLDDMVNMNIMLTGMVSDLSTGGKQLAVAHNFYDAICCMYKDVRRKYLHGEIVAMALPLQPAVNKSLKAEIEELKAFLREVGIPVSIREAGVPKEGLEELIAYVHRVTIPDDMELLEQIQDGFQYIM